MRGKHSTKDVMRACCQLLRHTARVVCERGPALFLCLTVFQSGMFLSQFSVPFILTPHADTIVRASPLQEGLRPTQVVFELHIDAAEVFRQLLIQDVRRARASAGW